MTQTVLSFDAPVLAASGPCDDLKPQEATSFEIGWDHARHGVALPAEGSQSARPDALLLRQGWLAGRATFGPRTGRPARAVRHWLSLRLQAWAQGRVFEDVLVTPRLLSQLEVPHCPVTREPLTQGETQPGDAVVMVLNQGAGCAAGNLAMVSRRVAAARGHCSAEQAMALAQRIESGEIGSVAGLDAPSWARLAGLLSLATPTPHARLATQPLTLLPPNRVRLLNPVQALQTLLTLLFTGGAYGRRLADLAALMPNPQARRRLSLFMSTLLARRLTVGWSADRERVRITLEDAWAHPVVRRRWLALGEVLTRADCERIVRLATQRGVASTCLRWLDDAVATEGWALDCQGQAASRAAVPPGSEAEVVVDGQRRMV